MRSKIIAVDFDGTLCVGDRWPNIGEPNTPLINYILERQKQGAKLILWTCRAGDSLTAAIEWSAQQGIIFDAVNDNIPETLEWYTDAPNCRKIYADEYIDDKAKIPEYVYREPLTFVWKIDALDEEKKAREGSYCYQDKMRFNWGKFIFGCITTAGLILFALWGVSTLF